jgi:hypothetical protein
MVSRLPEPVRSKPRILNCHSEVASTTVADNPHAAIGLYRDVLIRTPIPEQQDKCLATEKARPLLPLPQLAIVFRRFPTVAVSPSNLVDISVKGGHSKDLVSSTGSFRIDTLAIRGEAIDAGPDAGYRDAAVDMSLDVTADLSSQEETMVPFPETVDPRFPWYIEGKVLSEVGEEKEITYDLASDPVTSVPLYRIRIPLFENQEIQVPYEPATGAGSLYLPLYKGQRVMVALDRHSARFDRLLDWRPEALMAKDGQGQQLFLGKSQKSNTSLCHDYQSDKPVFRMQRTNDKDTAMFRLEEGKLTLRVEEQKG